MIQRIIKQAVRILGERGIRDELAGIPQSGISTRISTTEGVGATPAQPSRIRTTQTTPRPTAINAESVRVLLDQAFDA